MARLARLTAVLVAGTLIAGCLAVAVDLLEGDGIDHPDAWDPRVADLADFVEEARGRDFRHPVQVDFLTPEEYTEATTTEVTELQEEELDELERGTAQLRALGVVSGPLDLAEALNQTTDAGTLAFYSPEEERIRVRGTELTVGLRVTLVHELTHALQDQHFGLADLLDDDDSSAAVAGRALAEGDAMRIEDVYVETILDDDERVAYEAESEGDLERSEAATEGIPAFIRASFATPYALGRPFVLMLFNQGGNDAVDDAFEDPPRTEEHLFDPASFVAGEEGERVDLDLDEDEVDLIDEGAFGSPSWFLVLAERIDPQTAFAATLGWGGDRYAVYQRGGETCIRAVFRGDDEAEEREMAAAIEQWLAALPGGRATAIEVDGRPGLDACDPGPDVDLQVTGRSVDVLALPNVWGYLVAETIAQVGPDTSRCFASHVLEAISYERLVDPDAGEELSEEAERAGIDAVLACGSGDR